MSLCAKAFLERSGLFLTIYLLAILTVNQLMENKIYLNNLHILSSIERHHFFEKQIKLLLKQKICMNRI